MRASEMMRAGADDGLTEQVGLVKQKQQQQQQQQRERAQGVKSNAWPIVSRNLVCAEAVHSDLKEEITVPSIPVYVYIQFTALYFWYIIIIIIIIHGIVLNLAKI